jgi:hypothetical protein
MSQLQEMDTISCYTYSDASLMVNMSGGTAPYTYLWSDGGITNESDSLSSGWHSVMIIDANGCMREDSFNLSEPAGMYMHISMLDSVKCFGENTGQAFAYVSNTNPNYISYAWSNGENSNTANTLTSGWHSVIATDTNLCMVTDSIYIGQSSQISVDLSLDSVSCYGGNDGSINMMILGGIMPYDISWSHGDTVMNLIDLTQGTYIYELIDANGCMKKDTISLNTPDSALTGSFEELAITCKDSADARLTIHTSGGTKPYNYLWTGANSNDSILNELAPGIYSVVISDANSCQWIGQHEVIEPHYMGINFIFDTLLCPGDTNGIIHVQLNNGAPPYTYSWSNNSNLDSIINVGAGVYALTVSDSNNCIISDTAILNDPVLNRPLIKVEWDTVICYGDSVILKADTSYISYLWNTGEITSDIVTDITGFYAVEATDSNTCQIMSDSIWVESMGALVVDSIVGVTVSNVGELEIYTAYGDSALNYSWSVDGGVLVSGSGTEVVTVRWDTAITGSVSVIATDSNGCMSDTLSLNVDVKWGVGIVDVIGQDVKVYPNPTRDYFVIAFDAPLTELYELKIRDIAGRLVRSYDKSNMQKRVIYRQGLNSGMYIIEIDFKGHNLIGRIMLTD